MQNLFSLLCICQLPHPALYSSLILILSPINLSTQYIELDVSCCAQPQYEGIFFLPK